MLELLFEHEKHDAIIVSSKIMMSVLDVDKNGLIRTLREVFNEIRLFLDRLKSHLYIKIKINCVTIKFVFIL